jgi:hypothetical protein
VEFRLGAASDEELRALLRAMASRVRPTERQAFLEALSPERIAEQAQVRERAAGDSLLRDVEALGKQLRQRMEQAEWEEPSWYEEEAAGPGPYAEFVEPVTELFERAQEAFELGRWELARKAYAALFTLLSEEDDYGRSLGEEALEEVDKPEARGRYLRAVYLTAPRGKRAEAVLEGMEQVRAWLPRPRPRLEELREVSSEPLPEFDGFLREWEALLRSEEGAGVEAWLREAVRLSRGAQGLLELGREAPGSHPRAWVEGLTLLEREGEPRKVLATAQEALEALPAGLPLRAWVADFLASAAEQLGRHEVVRQARWEAFQACPDVERLLDVRDTGGSEPERARLMQRAARQVEEALARPRRAEAEWSWEEPGPRPRLDRLLLTHARLLAHDWEGAWALAAKHKVLGWTSEDNPQVLAVPFLLLLLSGQVPSERLPRSLAELWRMGLERSVAAEDVRERLSRAHAEVLPVLSPSRARQRELLEGCLKVASERVSAIVSHQYRRAYPKAAMLLAGCAEALRLRGEDRQAQALLTQVRQQFPRHRAFQSELDAAVRGQ